MLTDKKEIKNSVAKKPDLVIDFHVHIINEYVQKESAGKTIITGFGTQPAPKSTRGPRTRELTIPEVQIEEMDRDGVDINVLTAATIMQTTTWADPAKELELCQLSNDTVASWVAKYPKRFIGSFILPLQDMRLSMAEFERCVSQLGMPVVQLPACAKGAYMGEPEFHELWAAIYEKKLTAMIHPDGTRDLWFQKFRLWNSLGQPIEEAKVIASLIYEGILERYPGVKVVISHGGGMLPHYMGRLDRNVHNMPDSMVNISKKPSEYLRHLYFDSCVYTTEILEALVKKVGADRVILGSDYPVGDPDRVGFLRTPSNVSDEDFALMAGDTAAQLLGLTAQGRKSSAKA
jgi:aminocarboxymuconate-semialdehyde decarboxylase